MALIRTSRHFGAVSAERFSIADLVNGNPALSGLPFQLVRGRIAFFWRKELYTGTHTCLDSNLVSWRKNQDGFELRLARARGHATSSPVLPHPL